MTVNDLLFLGIKSHVVAFHKYTVKEVWRTQLKSENSLTGLGYDLASLAITDSSVSPSVVKKKKDAANDSQNPSSTTQVY